MKTLLKVPYYLLIAGVAIIGLLLLATLVPIPGNFKVKIVKSGSMEPAIRTGSIVTIRPASSYSVGDVITFGPDTKTQIPTTHRIVSVKGSGTSQIFTTKGDANDVADPTEIKLSDIDGKVLFTLPYVGFILDFARKPLGFALIVGIPALIVIFDELGKIWLEIQKMKTRKRKKYSNDTPHIQEITEEKPLPYVIQGNIIDLRNISRPQKEIRLEPESPSSDKHVSHFSWKILTVLLIVFIPLFQFFGVGSTISYYNTSESSLANMLQASGNYDTTDQSTGIDLETQSLADEANTFIIESDEPTSSLSDVIESEDTTSESSTPPEEQQGSSTPNEEIILETPENL